MDHEILHRCGHSQRHSLFGQFATDVDRQARRLARMTCSACYAAAKQTKVETDAASLADIALPTLVGSARQVAWASTIRIERLASLRLSTPAAVPAVANHADARWWIDHRDQDLAMLVAGASPP